MMLMQAMALPMQGSLLPQSQTSLPGHLQNGEVARLQPRISEALCRSLQRSEMLNYVNGQNCSLLIFYAGFCVDSWGQCQCIADRSFITYTYLAHSPYEQCWTEQ